MEQFQKQVALVFPSGAVKKSEQEQVGRVAALRELGFQTHEMPVSHVSTDGTTAATAIERAAMISHALTRRMYDVVWAARGGYGTTSLVKYLRNMLPPVLPSKVLVGFSDVSFLGVTLALQYPSITYVHGRNFFSDDLLNCEEQEKRLLFEIVGGKTPAPVKLPTVCVGRSKAEKVSGLCIPMNLSLAESLASLQGIKLPEGAILFLEDCNENTYRVLRKFDSFVTSGLLDCAKGIVVGCFSECQKPDGTNATETEIASYFSERTSLPVFVLPVFGHAERRFPLVAMSEVVFEQSRGAWMASLAF